MSRVLKNIAKTLCEHRKKLGISQEEMAALCGVSRQQYQRYEEGNTNFSVTRLVDISGRLKRRTSYLIGEMPEFPEVYDNLVTIMSCTKKLGAILCMDEKLDES